MEEKKAASSASRPENKALFLFSPKSGKKMNMGLSRTRDPENPATLQGVLDIVRFIGWHKCNANYYYEHRNKTLDNLVFICVAGGGILEQEGKTFRITPGSVTIFPNDVDVTYYTDPAVGMWEIYWMHVRGTNISNVFNHLYQNNVCLIQCQDTGRFVSLFEDILNSDEDGFSMTLYNFEKLSELTCLILKEAQGNGILLSENNSFIESVTKYIDENYSREITISDLAATVFMANESFIRAFRRYTGYTPYRYLKIYRIRRACELLTNTDLSVKEIAGSVGYKSVSNFISEFRSQKKVTPKKYRSDVK